VDVPKCDVVEPGQRRDTHRSRAADHDGVFTLRFLAATFHESVRHQDARPVLGASSADAPEHALHGEIVRSVGIPWRRVVPLPLAASGFARGRFRERGANVSGLVERHAEDLDTGHLYGHVALA